MKKLSLLFLIFLLPLVAKADDIEVENAQGVMICYVWINNFTELEVSYQGSSYSGEVIIPESVVYNGNTYSVTSIGKSAFTFCSGLTSVTIPNSVKNIGEDVFFNCSSLTSVTIPNSVTSIGIHAFTACSSLTSVTIGNSVTSIGNYAFSGCSSLTSVTIPNSVTSIGSYAFQGCSSLTSVTIGNSVTSIGREAFGGCSGLTSVTIGNSVTSIGYDAFSETPWYNNQSDGLIYAGKVAYKYKGTMPANTDIVIKNGTLGIACDAFRECSGLTSVTIPNSVTSIGESAFYKCSGLTAITIPNSVTSIGNYAFYDCSGLTSVTIPNSVKNIGENVFSNCSSLTSVTIGNSVTSIGNYAFSGCSSLTSVTIPNSVTSIGNSAFSGTAWVKNQPNGILYLDSCLIGYKGNKPSGIVIIENGTRVIAGSAFDDCSGLTSITIPNSVTSIGRETFEDCSGLTSVTIGNSVTSIGNSAFENCSSLTSVTIPNGVTSIGDYAFNDCNGLTSVTIGNSVTSIGWRAFNGCSGLTSVTIGNSVTSIGESAFEGCSGLTCITIPNSVTSIGKFAFRGGSCLTSVTIGNSVTSIGSEAFRGCSGLTTIVVESGNPNYDSRGGCEAIIEKATNKLVVGCMNTIIPNSVTSIGNYAFEGCSGLTSVTIPNSVTSIGSSAFSGCSGLTSVTIPNSVTSIGSSAFFNTPWYNNQPNGLVYAGKFAYKYKGTMPANTDIVIEDGTRGITGFAFDGCSGLTSVTIPNSVTSIGSFAFFGCSNLTSVTIPNSVKSIGNYAFWDCSNLNSVIVEREIPLQIIYNVFSNRANATLYVPVGCKAAYEAAYHWNEFKEIIEMPANGDLNGDGILNGVDLVAQTNLIMTGQYDAAADLNNDGVVNGLDYVIMVNLIMSFTSAPAMQATPSNRAAATSSLSIEDFDIKAGETKELFINLSNPNTDLTLLQFDMRLPEGLSIAVEDGDYAIDIAGRTTWKKHSLMAKATNGITRFLLASNSNALIDGDNGNVISIKLTASDGFTCGDIMLENQLLVSPDAEDVIPADFIYSVGGTTSIDAMGSKVMQLEGVYDLQGRRVKAEANSSLFTLHSSLKKGMYIVNGKKIIVK